MNMTGNSNSKSLLAKLLATENITIRHNAAAKTASFDIKNRTLEMPVWKGISSDLEDLLTVHETGHALDTPCDGWIEAIEEISKKHFDAPTKRQKMAIKNFLNVIEDARIDKRQKRRYPGSRRNYLAGYKELIERGFFGPPSRDFNTYGFIDRINLHFKGGVAAGIKFDREEMPFIKRIEDAETFAEVITVTDEVFGYCLKSAQQSAESDDVDDSDDDEAEGDDLEFEFDADGEVIDIETDAEGSETDQDADGESDKKKSKKKLVISAEGSSGDNDDDENVPDSETEKVWQNKQLELSDTNTQYVYATIPKPQLKNIVCDYKQFLSEHAAYSKQNIDSSYMSLMAKQLQEFKTGENNSISYMVKEFEMKKSADMYSKTSIAKTGVIDTNKLHSYNYNDDIFRRLATTPKGKNHGFIMFMDWSGSMQTDLKNTVKQLLSMVMFCKRVQIPFEVYSFRDLNRFESGSNHDRHEPSKTCFTFNKGDIALSSFKLRNILSSRMSITELNRAFQIVWTIAQNTNNQLEPMGGTPLNAAIIAATELVNQFRDRNKLQIVNTIFLTDGGSNPIVGLYQMPREQYVQSLTRTQKIRFVVQDQMTKKDYHMTSTTNGYVDHDEMTSTLLKILKDRTGCTLIGFYLFTATWGRGARAETVYANFYGNAQNEKHFQAMKAMWMEHKFMPVTSHGYDEYYIIDSSGMSLKQDELKVDTTMTKSKIAKAFLTFSNKKSVNRVLLQRFISSISAVNKAA